MALSTSTRARWTSLSSSAAIPSGRCRPSVFGMYALRDGFARYAPGAAAVQVPKVVFEVLGVLLPRHTVDARRRALLQGLERRAQAVNIYVVEERGEPHSLVPCCCFTYTVERTRRACPALCPGRVLLVRVPLGQSPSLHHRRSRSPGVVRRLRWYYGPVRLPLTVHRRRSAFGRSGASRRTICGGRPGDLPVLARGGSARASGLRPRRAARGLALSPSGRVAFRLG